MDFLELFQDVLANATEDSNRRPGRCSEAMHLIQGQLLRLSERREVAIYLRDGMLWVADFIDGDGELVEAKTWFRFNCGAQATHHARRRMVREAAIPLSRELIVRIDRLHRPNEDGRIRATNAGETEKTEFQTSQENGS
jgi:hypothetical protein